MTPTGNQYFSPKNDSHSINHTVTSHTKAFNNGCGTPAPPPAITGAAGTTSIPAGTRTTNTTRYEDDQKLLSYLAATGAQNSDETTINPAEELKMIDTYSENDQSAFRQRL